MRTETDILRRLVQNKDRLQLKTASEKDSCVRYLTGLIKRAKNSSRLGI